MLGSGFTRRPAKSGGSMLTRGLALLSAYRSDERELSQTELAKRTGLPKPTVHRLVAELVECGALERSRHGVQLGQWLYLLGARVPRIGLLRAVSQPYLDRLHELTREHTCLSVHGGDEAVDVAWSGRTPWRNMVGDAQRGTVSPAAMLALLAGDTDGGPIVAQAKLNEWLRAEIPAQRERRGTDFRLTSTAAAVSVFDVPVAVMSVVGPSDRFDCGATGSALRTTVSALARRLSATTEFCDWLADSPSASV